jgi:adenylate cyclase
MKRIRLVVTIISFLVGADVSLAQSMDSSMRNKVNTALLKLFEAEQWSDALALIKAKNEMAISAKLHSDIAFFAYWNGMIAKRKNQLDSAIQCFNASDKALEQQPALDVDFLQLQTAKNAAQLAQCHHEKYNYPLALDFYQKALRIYELRQDKRQMASLFSDLSLFYRDVGTFPKAFEYGFKALELHQAFDDKALMSYDLLNLAIYFDETGEYDKALEYYFKVLETNTGDLTTAYNNIASSYKNKMQYEKALDFASKAQKSALDNDDTSYLCLIEATFCEIYFLNQQWREALAHGQESIKWAREYQELEVIKAVSLILSQIYEKNGEPIKAYSFYKEHIAARDSLSNEIKERDITRKLALYDFEVQQQEKIKEQERKDAIASTEKKALYGGIAFLGIVAALIFRNFRREKKAKVEIAIEQQKSEELLLNILPKQVADELKIRGAAEAKLYEQATVLFADFKDFTKVSEQVSPAQLVALINDYFTEFDRIITKYNLEKIKTIGDAYVCAAGLKEEDPKVAAIRLIKAAGEMHAFTEMLRIQAEKEQKPYFLQRIGISSGAVVAGIVGVKKFTYDIWGDTVNVAARMEQHSEAGKINISESTYQIIKEVYNCTYRGKIEAKNKGEINMYFVNFERQEIQ